MNENIFHLQNKNLKLITELRISDLYLNIGIVENYLLEILKNKSLISIFRVIMPALHYNSSQPSEQQIRLDYRKFYRKLMTGLTG
jgi:hypothetical protein